MFDFGSCRFSPFQDLFLGSILSILPDTLQEIDIRNLSIAGKIGYPEARTRSHEVGDVLLRSKLESRFPLLQKLHLTPWQLHPKICARIVSQGSS